MNYDSSNDITKHGYDSISTTGVKGAGEHSVAIGAESVAAPNEQVGYGHPPTTKQRLEALRDKWKDKQCKVVFLDTPSSIICDLLHDLQSEIDLLP